MKLVFCPECNDMVNLVATKRSCECGQSSGTMFANGKAVIEGKGKAIGVPTFSLLSALRRKPRKGELGEPFKGFVLSDACQAVTYKDEQEGTQSARKARAERIPETA